MARSAFLSWGLILLGPALARPAAGQSVTPARLEVLDNGLRVLLREDHRQPLVAICTHVDGGSRTEGDELKGLSHYYEHTIFRGGTARQRELETRKRFRELGDFGGYTTDDHTTYYMVVPTARLDEALWRYADALLGLEVTEAKIEQDRQTVVQEYAMRVADSPAGQSWVKLFETAFSRHPYRLTPIGTLEVISGARIDRFRTFYQERYVPNQMVLAVVGDFEPEDMLRRIRDSFGRKPAGRSSFEVGLIEPPQHEFRQQRVEARSELAYGALGFKIPAYADPDTPAIRVLDAILLSGPSSRLWRRLKQERPLAVELSSSADARRDPSLWLVSFAARPADEEALVETLLEELGRVAREGVDEDELGRALSLLERDLLAEGETFLGQAVRLADHAIRLALPLEPRLIDDLRRVTASDVRRVARSYLRADRASLVRVGPPGEGRSWAERARELLPGAEERTTAAGGASVTATARLASGLRLVTRVDPGARLITLSAAVPGGLWVEGRGRAGESALLARLLSRGTRRLDQAALGRELDGLGARLDSSSDEDLTQVTLTAPAQALRQAVPLLIEVLLEPRLDPAVVDKARAETLAEIAAIPDDSFRENNVAFARALYGDHPYARPVLGEAADLAGIAAADLRALHAAVFRPANLVLSAVGSFDPAELRRLVEAGVGAVAAAGSGPAPVLGPADRLPPTPARRQAIGKEKAQATYDFGRLVPGLGHPSWLAYRVAATALGSRLFFRWVYEEGLAYRMWTRYLPRRGPSPFFFEMGVEPANLARALSGVETEALAAAREGIPDAEIDAARASIVQSHLLQMQTTAARGRAYARYEALGVGAAWVDELPERLAGVTGAAVREALRLAVDPARSTLVVLGPGSAPPVAGQGRTGPDAP